MERLAGHRINRYVRVLTHAHIYDVRFIHLYFRRHYRHIRERHDEAARRVLHSHYDVVAHALRQIAHYAVDRRGVGRLVENVLRARKNSLALAEHRLRLAHLRFQLQNLRGRRIHRRTRRIISRFALIEVLPGDQSVLEKPFAAPVIQLRLFEIRLLLKQIGLCGLVAGFRGLNS